jgi:hypothetical protein
MIYWHVNWPDFPLRKLKSAGGVMTLTDVYCLFNRARGTNLISPDDILTAASLFRVTESRACPFDPFHRA